MVEEVYLQVVLGPEDDGLALLGVAVEAPRVGPALGQEDGEGGLGVEPEAASSGSVWTLSPPASRGAALLSENSNRPKIPYLYYVILRLFCWCF